MEDEGLCVERGSRGAERMKHGGGGEPSSADYVELSGLRSRSDEPSSSVLSQQPALLLGAPAPDSFAIALRSATPSKASKPAQGTFLGTAQSGEDMLTLFNLAHQYEHPDNRHVRKPESARPEEGGRTSQPPGSNFISTAISSLRSMFTAFIAPIADDDDYRAEQALERSRTAPERRSGARRGAVRNRRRSARPPAQRADERTAPPVEVQVDALEDTMSGAANSATDVRSFSHLASPAGGDPLARITPERVSTAHIQHVVAGSRAKTATSRKDDRENRENTTGNASMKPPATAALRHMQAGGLSNGHSLLAQLAAASPRAQHSNGPVSLVEKFGIVSPAKFVSQGVGGSSAGRTNPEECSSKAHRAAEDAVAERSGTGMAVHPARSGDSSDTDAAAAAKGPAGLSTSVSGTQIAVSETALASDTAHPDTTESPPAPDSAAMPPLPPPMPGALAGAPGLAPPPPPMPGCTSMGLTRPPLHPTGFAALRKSLMALKRSDAAVPRTPPSSSAGASDTFTPSGRSRRWAEISGRAMGLTPRSFLRAAEKGRTDAARIAKALANACSSRLPLHEASALADAAADASRWFPGGTRELRESVPEWAEAERNADIINHAVKIADMHKAASERNPISPKDWMEAWEVGALRGGATVQERVADWRSATGITPEDVHLVQGIESVFAHIKGSLEKCADDEYRSLQNVLDLWKDLDTSVGGAVKELAEPSDQQRCEASMQGASDTVQKVLASYVEYEGQRIVRPSQPLAQAVAAAERAVRMVRRIGGDPGHDAQQAILSVAETLVGHAAVKLEDVASQKSAVSLLLRIVAVAEYAAKKADPQRMHALLQAVTSAQEVLQSARVDGK